MLSMENDSILQNCRACLRENKFSPVDRTPGDSLPYEPEEPLCLEDYDKWFRDRKDRHPE